MMDVWLQLVGYNWCDEGVKCVIIKVGNMRRQIKLITYKVFLLFGPICSVTQNDIPHDQF